MNGKILYEEESYAIRGAIFEVYHILGNGFLEGVYQEGLEREFKTRNIPFEAQKELCIYYKGEIMNQTFRPDFICYGKIIVEIKAAKELASEHEAQLINYLKAADFPVGLLVNFGSYPKAIIKRLVL